MWRIPSRARPFPKLVIFGIPICALAIASTCFTLNTSPSAPIGLWLTLPFWGNSPLPENTWVTAKPTSAKQLIGRVPHVLKRVWCDERTGCEVVTEAGYISFKKDRILKTLPFMDSAPRLSEFPDHPVWLYSVHHKSFDSRSFGPVPPHEIVEYAYPLITTSP